MLSIDSGTPPEHVELELNGFELGIATVEAARGHGLRPDGNPIQLVRQKARET